MLYTPSLENFREQVENSEIISGNLDFFEFSTFLFFFGKLRAIISKVGGKLWRWEGYINRKQLYIFI